MVTVLLGGVIEIDADRYALHHLHVVARSILRREKAEYRTGCAANLGYVSGVLSAISIDADLHVLPRFHEPELGLLEVGRDPYVIQRNQRHQVLSDAHVLAHFHALAGDDARHGCTYRGVTEVEPGLVKRCLSLLHLGRSLVRLGSLSFHLPGSGLRRR